MKAWTSLMAGRDLAKLMKLFTINLIVTPPLKSDTSLSQGVGALFNQSIDVSSVFNFHFCLGLYFQFRLQLQSLFSN